jgi:hypothetical protein
MELQIISEKPSVKVGVEKGGLLRYVQERDFGSDSGYDGNIRQRVLAMAGNALLTLFGKDGDLKTEGLPLFSESNRLRVTVEILPPGDEPEKATAEPMTAEYAAFNEMTRKELQAMSEQRGLKWSAQDNKDTLIGRLIGS